MLLMVRKCYIIHTISSQAPVRVVVNAPQARLYERVTTSTYSWGMNVLVVTHECIILHSAQLGVYYYMNWFLYLIYKALAYEHCPMRSY